MTHRIYFTVADEIESDERPAGTTAPLFRGARWISTTVEPSRLNQRFWRIVHTYSTRCPIRR